MFTGGFEHMANLIRWGWDPFKEMEKEMQEMADHFSRMLSRWPSRGSGVREALTIADWSPSVDISETDTEYLVKAEIPEVDKKDVKVTVQNGMLAIQGERRQEKEEKGKRFHRVERAYGSFFRTFELPDGIDDQKLKAEFKEGMLLVHLPKTEKAQSKTIEVKVE
jgi:HSP20 family protein